MSVPRSPKIQGPPIVSVTFTSGAKLKTFVCNLEGTPTPTVLWLKDGKVGNKTTLHSRNDSLEKIII